MLVDANLRVWKQLHTSDSLESRSWLGTPISSKKPCSRSMMVVTCWERYEVSMMRSSLPAATYDAGL